MRRFAAVTTCHRAGYESYGRNMIRSFDLHWPSAVDLHVYAEGFAIGEKSARIIHHDLLAESPELVAFRERHADDPRAHGAVARKKRKLLFDRKKFRPRIKTYAFGLGFRWDAVRFSHKMFSVFAAAQTLACDVLFWIDADTLFFRDVPTDFIEGLIPDRCLVGFLDRKHMSECGFVAYNLRHRKMPAFLAALKALYTEDTLFDAKEFNDCFLFDRVRRRFERRGCRTYDIGEGIGRKADHVLINSRLGDYMDHMKGSRKEAGHSRSEDLIVRRDVDYWNAIGRASADELAHALGRRA